MNIVFGDGWDQLCPFLGVRYLRCPFLTNTRRPSSKQRSIRTERAVITGLANPTTISAVNIEDPLLFANAKNRFEV
jgi:hypothetical protein